MPKKSTPSGKRLDPSQANRDNRARQLNPERREYWQARGLPGRPPEENLPNKPKK